MQKPKILNIFAWTLSSLVLIVAIVAWGQGLNWHLSHIKALDLFPVFGLSAFSLMWTHYIVSAVRQYIKVDKKSVQTYFEATSLVVLLAIFAHPGILEWTLWRSGDGLPPTSVYHYVGPGFKIAATIGMVSLLVFLAYELRRWYEQKQWWKYVGYATDAAMLFIFFHSIKLGHNLQAGWLRTVWLIYGATLIMAMAYIYNQKFASQE
ncbi:MAG: hypothetical protein ACXWLH_03760 [Candidatus Saccharimonadales bacterium]